MKQNSIKQVFYIALLIFSIGCLFAACSKITPKPNSQNKNPNGGNDSTLAVDTLPSFDSPAGIALDAAGNIYVADYGNNLIRKITPGGIVSTFAGSGTQGSTNGTGVLSTFNQPAGIAADASGNLYIADAGNDLIRKITPAAVVSTLAGVDSAGSANGAGIDASFFHPTSVSLDASGNIYVADAGNNLIRKITTDGTVSTFAGNIASGTSNGTLTATSLNNPTGVATNASGNVFVANTLNNNILEINPTGAVSAFAGADTIGAINGPAASATFYFPNSVAVDATGNVYVADGVNNLIRKITPGGLVSTLAGSGMAGAVDSTGTKASFNGPGGLAVDAAGNVYVADVNNNLIRKITPTGVVTTIAGNGQPGSKNGLAIAHRNKRQIKITSGRRFNIFYKR